MPHKPDSGAIETAIDAYWTAIADWQKAHKKMAALAQRLDPEIMREPRASCGRLIGSHPPKPIYAYFPSQVDNILEPHKSAALSIMGHSEAQRSVIKAQFEERAQRLKEEIERDRESLYAAQRSAGWRQALEAEQEARDRVYRARERISNLKPPTQAAAISLVGFVNRATDLYARRNILEAPYGLGEYYTRRILTRALGMLNPEVSTRRAA